MQTRVGFPTLGSSDSCLKDRVHLKLKEISADTANTVRPGKNFRNLIHPGLVQRKGVQCDRGTAHTTYGAIFNVVRDLTANHP